MFKYLKIINIISNLFLRLFRPLSQFFLSISISALTVHPLRSESPCRSFELRARANFATSIGVVTGLLPLSLSDGGGNHPMEIVCTLVEVSGTNSPSALAI